MRMRQLYQMLSRRLWDARVFALLCGLSCAVDAQAQGWPFTDAPEAVIPTVQQTSNVTSIDKPKNEPPKAGVIMSAETLDLGEGEVVVGGDPILRETGILENVQQAIPLRPLHHSGRGPRRRTTRRFGPRDSYLSYWGCPEGCTPTCYGHFEGLYFSLEEDEFNESRNIFDVGETEYEPGIRVTFGRMCDCSVGYEFTFAGMLEWDHGGTLTSAMGLNYRPTPNGSFNTTNLQTFYTGTVPHPTIPLTNVSSVVTSQTQRLDVDLDSYEFNRRIWGWDVVSTVMGIRAINYNEDFTFTSINELQSIPGTVPPTIIANGQGIITQNVENIMVGPQLGLDLMYPMCRRLMVGAKFRGSVFVNRMEVDTQILQDTDTAVLNFTTMLNNNDDEYDLSAMWEQGIYMSYHFSPSFAVKGGFEFWYLYDIATVDAHRVANVNGLYGSDVLTEDVLVTGFHAGAEVMF